MNKNQRIRIALHRGFCKSYDGAGLLCNDCPIEKKMRGKRCACWNREGQYIADCVFTFRPRVKRLLTKWLEKR